MTAPFGIGPGRFGDLSGRDAHSLFVGILGENEWLAFGGLLILLAGIARACLGNLRPG